MSNVILQAVHLNKYFHEPESFQVLKDVSLAVNKGEFVALIGKSGSGKSTLLYLLSTLDTEYEGEIIINGTKVTGKSQNELAAFRNENIGFVFQFHYLLPEFTALQNVMIPARKLGKLSLHEIEMKAMEKLKMMNMEGFAQKPSGKLSGGQQQRVAIARALINEPSIIMADEPTGNLDSANSKNIFEIFNDLSRNKGNTIITVTHDVDFAKRANRTIELADGRLLQQ
ncbi:ATP-binding protein [Niastella koreensis]|uniref:Phosphonate-transporting ATPase n=2 Tax=Niastella koreensis TaxID=354356 RepID=G8TD32_NIAKG|nr:ABC transporter ATP-binding protein [Niastella koreensis]AEV98264.1 Phosphonate-transporting ATPase [Niastella koreensis GR20-10]OQP53282.1 ATP-binding protein [Niastella koreensis]